MIQQRAMSAIDQKVAELRARRPEMTAAAATAEVLRADPRLYDQYLAENPAQTGR